MPFLTVTWVRKDTDKEEVLSIALDKITIFAEKNGYDVKVRFNANVEVEDKEYVAARVHYYASTHETYLYKVEASMYHTQALMAVMAHLENRKPGDEFENWHFYSNDFHLRFENGTIRCVRLV